MTEPNIWRITCMEDDFPGMWQRWLKHQCVAVGWPPGWKFHLDGKTKDRGWSRARNALAEIKKGDLIIVALAGRRIGRLGEVVSKAVYDSEWDPLVPPGPGIEEGEMGRRVLVRWDMVNAPADIDLVIQMPADFRFTSGEQRSSLQRIYSRSIEEFRAVARDPANWVGLRGKFGYEKALSDYIALNPNRLEDGLIPHPNGKIREYVFKDKSRLDVILLDREGMPVIVECKQDAPAVADVRQLRGYLERLADETGKAARGILVHGGARKLHAEVRAEAARRPRVELVQYRLDVDFSPSS